MRQLAALQKQQFNSVLSFTIQRDLTNDLFSPTEGFVHAATIEEAGLRKNVRIMIGGGVITEKIREYTGADAYAADAMAGVRLCKQWI